MARRLYIVSAYRPDLMGEMVINVFRAGVDRL